MKFKVFVFGAVVVVLFSDGASALCFYIAFCALLALIGRKARA